LPPNSGGAHVRVLYRRPSQVPKHRLHGPQADNCPSTEDNAKTIRPKIHCRFFFLNFYLRSKWQLHVRSSTLLILIFDSLYLTYQCMNNIHVPGHSCALQISGCNVLPLQGLPPNSEGAHVRFLYLLPSQVPEHWLHGPQSETRPSTQRKMYRIYKISVIP
jgi:hypothetical protein